MRSLYKAIRGGALWPGFSSCCSRYPVVVNIYPGPQGGSVGSWSFSAVRRDNQSLAELGFVVVPIEGLAIPTDPNHFTMPVMAIWQKTLCLTRFQA